ncbi:hypothetical protein MFIFM68171_05973 [Madurella fahalii]|uniref:Alpha/beta hydrolase fold-3 domain-containing protein n=1 Tax=Madurella fahalii TaxID=1157608 RepID=A0ABQ0GDC0_9PEZI
MPPEEPNPGPKATTKTAPDKPPSMLSMILPQLPLMLRVALFHILRLSEQSKYLDLRTELIVAVMRAYINPSQPWSITATQKLLSHHPPIKGRIWISTYTCPPPPAGETGLQDALTRAIDGLWNPKTPRAAYQLPDPAPVEAEWTGYRAAAASDAQLPQVSQRELYAEMMKEVKNPVTVLYFHGGAYWLMDPATHRQTTKTLAKLTGGRVYSVRYRLAPQNPFPAALMDALMSYLALLYPPEGAFHEPVKPEHIVFAGDSAGGNLALSLLQLLLHLSHHSHPVPIPWHGWATAAPLPLPAGVAVNSPWLDLTHSSPSCTANAAFDYLPTPEQQRLAEAKRPPCAAWPPDNTTTDTTTATTATGHPPRKHLYAPDALLTHPLVTLLLAPSWRGAPPTYICAGWELLADEDRHAARKMWRDGARTVVLEEYEGMPHCFGLVLPHLKEARRCLAGWAGFIKGAVAAAGEGRDGGGGVGESRFVTIRAKTLEEEVVDPREVCEGGRFEKEEAEVEERIWRRVRGGLLSEEGIAKL